MKHPGFFLFFSFLLFYSSSFAQYDVSHINKKAVAAYTQGIEKAQADDFNAAIPLFKQAIALDAKYIDAYLSLAGVYGQLKNHEQSVYYYQKAFAIDSNYTSDYRLSYSINLAGLGKFEAALQTIQQLLQKPMLNDNTRKAAEYRKKTYQFAVDYDTAQYVKNYAFNPINLGDSINTSESEYFPSLPIDGGALIFTRRLNNFNEDFFISAQTNAGWSRSQRLPGSINTPQNEGAQVIAQDGQWLVFTGCNRPDGSGSCDLYISYKTPQGWSEAINLGQNVNSENWESQPCLSPDKQELYFTSRRPGGFGGSDLYVCKLGVNGKWSAAENLGAGINTSADEACPFIHADNQTLYFTSSGWRGYGDDDLFMARRDAKGAWGEPKNLGSPINTIHREGTLFIAADGKTAYYASDRSDSKGGLDIYSFELRYDLRPAKTLWVRGKVFDKKTGNNLRAQIELTDLATGRVFSKVQTDEQGQYLVTLPVGKDYAFNVARKGYLFYSDAFSLTNGDPDAAYQKDIPLQPIEVNATVVLKNIFFDVAKYDLKKESLIELDKVVQLLQENSSITIQISGHTDNVGQAADNAKLSQNRAGAVVAYLTSKGISAKRLLAKGFGASQPVADNSSEAGRAQNRRTEIKVLSK